jgi:hypothetical protein
MHHNPQRTMMFCHDFQVIMRSIWVRTRAAFAICAEQVKDECGPKDRAGKDKTR